MVVKIFCTVKNIGNIPVFIKVRGFVKSPDGRSTVYSSWSNNRQLNPNQSVSYELDVPTTPYQSGQWIAGVEVYDIVDRRDLAVVTKPFTVQKKVAVNITKIQIV